MLRHAIATFALVFVAAGPVMAEVRLVHKPAEGRSVRHLIEMKLQQTLTVGEMPIETDMHQFLNMKGKAGQRTAAGELPVEVSFESIQVTLNTPGGKVEFDSNDAELPAEGDPARPFHEMYRAMNQSSWTYVYGPENKVREVKARIPEQLQGNAFVADLVDETNLRQERNQELSRLPDKPVNEGDTWERVERMNMGAGQTFTFDVQYTYAGTLERDGRTLHKITGKPTKVSYAQAADSPTPLKVTRSELKPQGEVELLFDPQFGDFAETTSKLRITGDMALEFDGQQFPGKLDLTMDVKAQTQAEP